MQLNRLWNISCADIDECSSRPCRNGATCSTPGPAIYSCKCTSKYPGDTCEIGKFSNNYSYHCHTIHTLCLSTQIGVDIYLRSIIQSVVIRKHLFFRQFINRILFPLGHNRDFAMCCCTYPPVGSVIPL